MSTIVGVETDRGVALAADRASVTAGTVGGSVDRIFELDGAATAAVGDPGDVASFGRRLRSELDRDRMEREGAADVDRLARIASGLASEVGVDAIVAGRDDDGVARIRAVDSSGGVLSDAVASYGTGAPVALGALEGSSGTDSSVDPEGRVREVFDTVADRDARTGDDVDAWSLSNDS